MAHGGSPNKVIAKIIPLVYPIKLFVLMLMIKQHLLRVSGFFGG